MVFVNHGEDETVKSYANCLADEYGFTVSAPYSGAVFDLLQDDYIAAPAGIPIVKRKPKQQRSDSAFNALVAAGEKLMALIRNCKDIPNKELGKFAGQVNALTDKWASWGKKK